MHDHILCHPIIVYRRRKTSAKFPLSIDAPIGIRGYLILSPDQDVQSGDDNQNCILVFVSVLIKALDIVPSLYAYMWTTYSSFHSPLYSLSSNLLFHLLHSHEGTYLTCYSMFATRCCIHYLCKPNYMHCCPAIVATVKFLAKNCMKNLGNFLPLFLLISVIDT